MAGGRTDAGPLASVEPTPQTSFEISPALADSAADSVVIDPTPPRSGRFGLQTPEIRPLPASTGPYDQPAPEGRFWTAPPTHPGRALRGVGIGLMILSFIPILAGLAMLLGMATGPGGGPAAVPPSCAWPGVEICMLFLYP